LPHSRGSLSALISPAAPFLTHANQLSVRRDLEPGVPHEDVLTSLPD
jgi:hypothetical protein